MLMRELVKCASRRDLAAPSRNLTAASLRKSDECAGGTIEVVLPNSLFSEGFRWNVVRRASMQEEEAV